MPQPPLTLLCHTAQAEYTTTDYTMAPLTDSVTMVWAMCPLCDVYGRTWHDPGYDPTRPQPHGYPLTTTEHNDAAA